MNYTVETHLNSQILPSGAMLYVPSFAKIGSGTQKLMRRINIFFSK
jgi:hypothetical protein